MREVLVVDVKGMKDEGQEPSRYGCIASILRDEILSGQIRPGSRMTGERDLCERFRVSRVTVRRALRILEDESLVLRRHGSGTYVAPSPQRRIPLMIDYTGSMRLHAPALLRNVLFCGMEYADAAVAGLLSVKQGAGILYSERTDRLEDGVVACDRVYIAAGFAGLIGKEELARVDFIETWCRVSSIDIELCRQSVEAVAADKWVCERLLVRKGAPVLKSTETYFVKGSRPAGFFVSYYNPDRVCITSSYHWGSASGAGRQVL